MFPPHPLTTLYTPHSQRVHKQFLKSGGFGKTAFASRASPGKWSASHILDAAHTTSWPNNQTFLPRSVRVLDCQPAACSLSPQIPSWAKLVWKVLGAYNARPRKTILLLSQACDRIHWKPWRTSTAKRFIAFFSSQSERWWLTGMAKSIRPRSFKIKYTSPIWDWKTLLDGKGE